ncbi:MAG TPA: phospholipid carrier-dependent glycosyltransferase [Chloroflexi bacterium]|nr:phospholipid carrier-dependent glycosyltransferase [Chloroflexota bacterium]
MRYLSSSCNILNRYPRRHLERLLLLLLVVVAAFFRLWKITEVPPGLSHDEADWGHIALRIIQGHLLQISELGTLQSYFSAPFVLTLGRTPLALRLGAAISGILTVPILYLWAYEAFQKRLVAFLSASLYAITFACIHLNRLAFPPNPLPLLQVALYYSFWRWWRRKERWSLVVSGLLLGLTLYTYQASLALIFAMGLFWLGWVWKDRDSVRARLGKALPFWGAFLAIASYFLFARVLNPHYFRSHHFTNQFILNPEVHKGSLWSLLARQFIQHIGFFGFTGDHIWRHNLPGRPLFDPLISLFFWAGLFLALRKVKSAPFAFLVLNFAVMLLPGLLARTDTGPHLLHLSGVLALSCLFPALAMDWILEVLGSRGKEIRRGLIALLCILLAVEGYRTYLDYFNVWAEEVKEVMAFDEIFVRTAYALNHFSPQPQVWILPNHPGQPKARPPSSFTFVYTAPVPFHSIRADESVAPEKLEEALEGVRRVGLVEWDWDALKWAAPVYGDKKGLLRFLLERAGRLQERQSYGGFTLSIYELMPSSDFSIPSPSVHSLDLSFGDLLSLKACDLGGAGFSSIPSGERLWVMLRWSAMQPLSRDYKAAIYVMDAKGHLIAQDDRLILDRTGMPTSSWEPGQGGWDCRLIPIPPGTPPGEYLLGVAVYDAETLAKLPVNRGERISARIASAARFRISKAVQHYQPQPGVPLDIPLGEPAFVRWLGYDPPAGQVRPGDKMVLAFYWQAIQAPPSEGQVTVMLKDAGGTSVQASPFPIGGAYPPSEWSPGEVVTDRYDFILDRTIPGGVYTLHVRIQLGGFAYERDIGTIEVLGWSRTFQQPSVQHPCEAYFGDEMKLVGYGLGEAEPGEKLGITLCWQALREMSTSYVTFVHLLNSQGMLVSQMDAVPGGGRYPTTGWLKGEFICAKYELPLPESLKEGPYSIEVGVYDPRFEQRLPVRDASGTLVGDSLIINPGQP